MSIDYASTEIPDEDEEPPEQWHYTERRAWLLREIRRRGTPSAVSRVDAADRFGVTHGQISQDITALAESAAEHRGGNRAKFAIDTTFEKSVEELLASEEWKDAAKVAKDYGQWLGNTGGFLSCHATFPSGILTA